ncbi:MAG TPA: hypothetical protein VFP93_03150 [Gammaproteobacteria bacterium]|nr:hypothetical protein [Gammaproteobacteria bacterium]
MALLTLFDATRICRTLEEKNFFHAVETANLDELSRLLAHGKDYFRLLGISDKIVLNCNEKRSTLKND